MLVSGNDTASTYAPTAGRSAAQSNTCPTTLNGGKVGPVEKAIVRVSFRALPRRSTNPGSIVTRYAVFGRKPFLGRTSTRVRCQDTTGSPVRGEMRKI